MEIELVLFRYSQREKYIFEKVTVYFVLRNFARNSRSVWSTELYSGPSRTSFFAENTILGVWLGSEYTFVLVRVRIRLKKLLNKAFYIISFAELSQGPVPVKSLFRTLSKLVMVSYGTSTTGTTLTVFKSELFTIIIWLTFYLWNQLLQRRHCSE